jgi:environmental stress-induced protein Ves
MILPAAGYRAMAWKNGLGVTHEIAREPADGDSFLWRLSIAEVAADGDFSLFPGVDRTITLIKGAGMALDFREAPARRIDRRFTPFDFSGDWHCRCRLIDGPIRDFNLMVDRARIQASTQAVRLEDEPLAIEAGEGRVLVYCGEGVLHAGGFAAQAGDTLNLGGGSHVVTGPGALGLVMQLHMRRGR